VASEIERNGGTVRRVVLDYELKEELYRDVNKLGSANSPDQERERIASRHGLKVVDGTIPIPDLRIEYENEARHIEHIDMEFATREYRSQGMASKARAGFHMFARHHDIPRLRRVLSEQELTARIFALRTSLACTASLWARLVTPKTKLVFSTSWPRIPATSPASSLSASSTASPENAA
jgi:hypothetical protein